MDTKQDRLEALVDESNVVIEMKELSALDLCLVGGGIGDVVHA